MQKIKVGQFILLGVLGFVLSSDLVFAQAPGIMNFQVLVKNPSGQLVTTALPVSIRAQYLARDLANTKWCAIYEEGFASSITNGVLNLRLGDGARLGPGVTPISGIGNVSAEFLIEDSSVNDISRMPNILSLNQIVFQTRCIVGNAISSPFSSWNTESATLDLLPSARALRLHIVLPGNISVTPGFSLNALPFAVSSKKSEKLTGSMGASVGQILKWNGVEWVPDNLSGGDYTAGNGIVIDPVGRTIEINPGEIPISPIADGSVTEVKIANNAVTTSKIQDASVTGDKILDSSIEAGKIQDGAVTNAKIQNGAITADKVLDGSVTDAKIASVDWLKIDNTPTTLMGYGITDAASTASLNNYVLKAGDTMTGALHLPTNGLTVGTNQFKVSANGVGIGVATVPEVALEVSGQILSKVHDAGASTAIDWNLGNIQYTTATPQAITFTNLKEGGSYTLIAKDTTTSGTFTFSHAGIIFKFVPANGPTTLGKETVYTFIVAGGVAYVSWITGF